MAELMPDGTAIPSEVVAKHAAQVAAGLIPKDSPRWFVKQDAVNDAGLPWWFPPDFKADVPVGWGAERNRPGPAEPVTRAAIERQFRYSVQPISQPVLLPLPKRKFTKSEIKTMRQGYMAQVMEEHWHAFAEEDRFFFVRSWTGYTTYEAVIAERPHGFEIVDAQGESDPGRYCHQSMDFDCAELEKCFVYLALGAPGDRDLDDRWQRALSRVFTGPRLRVIKATGPAPAITKPGPSVKHGKVAALHPLQKEAYDKMVVRGYQGAVKAMEPKAPCWPYSRPTPADVWFSARRHEHRAEATAGIESSQHAGLAKGAKLAAWEATENLLVFDFE